MSRPADLEGLPWPDGEPGPLRAAAGRLRGLGSGLSGASGTLGGATPTGWSGVAAGSYAATIAQAGDAVSYLDGTVQTAASALSDLADRIEEAQDEVRRAAAKLHEARIEAADAQRRATAARAEAVQARATALLNPSPLTFADPLSQAADAAEARAASAESLAADKQADEQRVEAWAHRQADAAIKSVKVADSATAGALEASGLPTGLAVGGPPMAAGAQALWHFVYDVAVKPFNPYDSSYNDGERATVVGGLSSGIFFGTGAGISQYAATHWMRNEPGYWVREPRWVNPYVRSTPSGGTTTVSGYMRKGVWADSREVPDLASRAEWATRAKWFTRGGAATAFIAAGAGQYFDDLDNPNLDTSQRAGRVAAQSVTVGGAGALGAWGGATAGAAAGAAIGSVVPILGTAAGGVVGGVIGGIVGGGVAGGLVDHFNNGVVDWAGNAANDAWDWTSNAGSDIGHWASGAVSDAGDVLDSLNPF